MATPKKLIAVPATGTGLYRVQFEGGGQLPEELEGRFTSREVAQTNIDIYVENKNKGTKK